MFLSLSLFGRSEVVSCRQFKPGTLPSLGAVKTQKLMMDVTLGQLAVLAFLRLHVHWFGLCNHLTNLCLHSALFPAIMGFRMQRYISW